MPEVIARDTSINLFGDAEITRLNSLSARAEASAFIHFIIF